jgi:hypothetical protein
MSIEINIQDIMDFLYAHKDDPFTWPLEQANQWQLVAYEAKLKRMTTKAQVVIATLEYQYVCETETQDLSDTRPDGNRPIDCRWLTIGNCRDMIRRWETIKKKLQRHIVR